jgi:uncharacterized protein YbaA (DUF1428 family)
MYFDTTVLPVKAGRKDDYIKAAKESAALFLDYGALRVIETYGDADVPEGKQTDLWRAVAADKAGGEGIVVTSIVWPSKVARDDGWGRLMRDGKMKPGEDMPFDMGRMIFGGFDLLLDTAEG